MQNNCLTGDSEIHFAPLVTLPSVHPILLSLLPPPPHDTGNKIIIRRIDDLNTTVSL